MNPTKGFVREYPQSHSGVYGSKTFSFSNLLSGVFSQTEKALVSISLLRCAAAFFVVHYHVGHRFKAELGFMLAFVVMTSALVTVPKGWAGWSKFFSCRFQRLILPWLFWCIVYALIKLGLYLGYGKPMGFNIQMILFGTEAHLWYLPFVFLGATLTVCTLSLFKPFLNTCTLVVTTVLGVVVATYVYQRVVVWPFSTWLLATPAVLWGTFLAFLKGDEVKRSAILWGGFFVIVTCVILIMVFPYKLPLATGIAVFLTSGVWVMKFKSSKVIEYCSGLTFGIYLIHPLFLKLIWSMETGFNSVGIALTAFVASAGLTALLQKTCCRRFV